MFNSRIVCNLVYKRRINLIAGLLINLIVIAGRHCDSNKCIGDDTKAAARQSLNCIKNKKNMSKNDFQYGG